MAGEKVYVIEDDLGTRRNYAKYLRVKGGYVVEEFPTVEQAAAHMGWRKDKPQLTINLPDAIITDNDTPGDMKGLDLLRLAKQLNDVREAARERKIALIMCSGGPSWRDVKNAGGEEAEFMSKDSSFTLRGLVDCVNKLLEAGKER